MKKSFLLVLMMACVLITQAQEKCNDIVYPANKEDPIKDCCINAVKYGNVVFYKKDGKTAMMPAFAITRNGEYIELRKNKSSQIPENQLENLENKSLSIGDHYQGGIVFFIDMTGEHGLIAAPYDQTNKKVAWGSNGSSHALSPNDGQFNSKKILEYHYYSYTSDRYHCAARLCDELTIGNYTDWYLPSIDELKMVYDNRNIIGNFLVGDYCSSTEYGAKDAYSIHFKPDKKPIFFYNKVDEDYFVRCIRKF